MSWPKQAEIREESHQRQRGRPRRRVATAPFNFVPLPQTVVEVDDVPARDVYHPANTELDAPRYTGYLDCSLSTLTPLFIRGLITLDDLAKLEPGMEDDVDYADRVKNKPAFFHIDKETGQPVIPGSSLRGLLRAMIEIVAFGKMEWVTQQRLVYRAVADPSTSIRKLYHSQMKPGLVKNGERSAGIYGGYLHEAGGKWFIRPAVTGAHGESFVRIDYEASDMPKKSEEDDKYDVRDVFDIFVRPPNSLTTTQARHMYADINDKEHFEEASKNSSPREGFVRAKFVRSGHLRKKHYHYGIYAPSDEPLLPVSDDIRDIYRDDADMHRGIATRKLKSDDPLFYLLDDDGNVVFFGPTLMFRLPYKYSPYDHIPKSIRSIKGLDFAEAMFGYIGRSDRKVESYASRLTVGSATIVNPMSSYLEEPVKTLKILSTPKPTSFQHYLVQANPRGMERAHYDDQPETATVIRGHKLYWHKERVSEADYTEEQVDKNDTQHTTASPVGVGKEFAFRVNFENLTKAELGALLWAIELPAENGPYHHKLGMGKPYGLGSVALKVNTLMLSDRKQRYSTLFHDGQWAVAEQQAETEPFIKEFEEHMIAALGIDHPHSFADLDRIQQLLLMLKWEGPANEKTAYMGFGESKDRPILQTPSDLLHGTAIATGVVEKPFDPVRPRREPKKEWSSVDELEEHLKNKPERSSQIGQKVQAIVIAKEGNLITVRIKKSNEEISFRAKNFNAWVNTQVKVVVTEESEAGEITMVRP